MKFSVMKTACLLLSLLLTPSLAKTNGKNDVFADSRGDEIKERGSQRKSGPTFERR